jgi:hypothetical protein
MQIRCACFVDCILRLKSMNHSKQSQLHASNSKKPDVLKQKENVPCCPINLQYTSQSVPAPRKLLQWRRQHTHSHTHTCVSTMPWSQAKVIQCPGHKAKVIEGTRLTVRAPCHYARLHINCCTHLVNTSMLYMFCSTCEPA